MFGEQLIAVVFYIANVIAIALALWLAFRLETAISILYMSDDQIESRSGRIFRVLSWLGLGYFLSLPFTQVLGVLQTLANAFSPQLAGSTMSRIAWGVAPFWLWAVLNALLMIVVYVLFYVVASPILGSIIKGPNSSLISDGMATLAVLAGGAIAWSAISMISSFVLRPEVAPLRLSAPDRGVVGFLGGWIIALIIVVALGLYHDSRQADQLA